MKVIPFIAGPTGVGKSRVALRLAERLGAEIVSADSRQVFQELSIGTARPSEEDCARVPHHLVGDRSIRDGISAGVFARDAERTIRSIQERGGSVIVVGGSTLYLQALVIGLADIPPVPPDIRERLNERLRVEGPEVLHRELLRLDPAFAATLDPTKSHRIVRGLEVHAATGRPLSSYFAESRPSPFSFDVVVLNRERSVLYERINRRVDEMIALGLVDEVRSLIEQGFTGSEPALQTIGYREVFEHYAGETSSDEMVDRIKRNSRRYAKRQLTWYRRQAESTWIDLESEPSPVDMLSARYASR